MQICLLWDEFLGVSCLRYINACNVELPTFTHSTAISSPKPHQRLCSSYFWPWCRYFQLWIHFYVLSLSQCKLVAVVNTIFLIVSDSITKYSTSPLLDLKAPFHQTTTESLLFHVHSNLIFKHCPFFNCFVWYNRVFIPGFYRSVVQVIALMPFLGFLFMSLSLPVLALSLSLPLLRPCARCPLPFKFLVLR